MSAPIILPTVELPDRVSAWSYDFKDEINFFRYYFDGFENTASFPMSSVEAFIEAKRWQQLWDRLFEMSIARADEVQS